MHIKHIFQTYIRSRLEYASTLWHSSLTENNRKDIERLQKSAMKVIFRNEYQGYERSLKILKMESLNERRDNKSLKFAKKSLKQEKVFDMFPKNKQSKFIFRSHEKFVVNRANTWRYQKSAIPFLQKKLNESVNIERKQQKKLKSSLLRVNSVSYVDSIT